MAPRVCSEQPRNVEILEFPEKQRLNWPTTLVLVLLHIMAIGALFMFSWANLAVLLFLLWFATGLGISMGYHRLHTHRSYQVPLALEYLFAVCGALTFEGGPIFWVATHRIHHQKSDHAGRSALAARWRMVGARGLDPVRRSQAQQHQDDVEVRA